MCETAHLIFVCEIWNVLARFKQEIIILIKLSFFNINAHLIVENFKNYNKIQLRQGFILIPQL